MTKLCPSCHRQLPLTAFGRRTNRKNFPDGHDSRCLECRRAEKRAYYARHNAIPEGTLRHNSRGQAVQYHGLSVRLYWPPMTQQDFIRRFPYERNEDLAIDFNCSPRTIVRRARQLHLQKDPTWLHTLWDHNRHIAHRLNRLPSTRHADLTNFINGGRPHRFQPGHRPNITPEQRIQAWVTRRRNAILNQRSKSS